MVRRGVTLLEVLFAIGVVAVGLLGVMAIMPVALHQIGRGNVADRALRLGQNSIAQSYLEEFNDTDSWVWRDPAAAISSPPSLWSDSKSTHPTTSTDPWLYRSFAIDPLFIERNGFVTNPLPPIPNGPYLDAARFPYVMFSPEPTPPNPRMERITLRSNFRRNRGTFGTISETEANALFVLSDELALELSEDVSFPPIQRYTQTKRESEGTFSWLATLTPAYDGERSSFPSNFVLSIAVFHRRNMAMPMDGETEKVAAVTAFANAGYGGGDVTLAATSEQDVQTGQWILLMGQVAVTSTFHIPIFKWYQVIGTSGAPDASGTLDVTLQGPDWPASTPTQAGIFKNVVAVFEQTVVIQNGG